MDCSKVIPFLLLLHIMNSYKPVLSETANAKQNELSTFQYSKLKQQPPDFTNSQLSGQQTRATEQIHSSSSQYLNDSCPCPSWSYCDYDGLCKCPDHIPNEALDCDPMGKVIAILSCYCVTYDEKTNTTEVGYCDYNCVQHGQRLVDVVYHSLPSDILEWNEAMCGLFNRSGTLCGQCKDGFYPRAYSFDLTCITCMDGKSNWWKYAMSAFLPLTLFYFTILFLKVSIPSSQLQGFAVYSQIVSMPMLTRVMLIYTKQNSSMLHVVQFHGMIYGIWNLDFFRLYNPGICLQTGTLATLSLDLAVAVYPLLLMAITYVMIRLHNVNFTFLKILWKPFHAFFSLFKRNWDFRTSTVDAFATFLFLSNVKFLSICADLLVPVKVYQFNGNSHHTNSTNSKVSWRLYYDATIPYFGHDHRPYAILAIVALCLFVILPTLILLLYTFSACQKCLHLFPPRWQIFLHTFVDSFQGCYKDGTEPGTRDCRWFAAVPFILRLFLTTLYASTLNSSFTFAAIMVVLAAIIVIVVDPYKSHLKTFSQHFGMFILFLACFATCAIGINEGDIKADRTITYFIIVLMVVFSILPLLYLSVLILQWTCGHRKFGLEIFSRLKVWRLGFSLELTE